MAYDYSTKTLTDGGIGGRGFWLCKETRAYRYIWNDLSNINLNLERPLAEALTYNTKLPFILNQSVLELFWDSYDAYQFGSGFGTSPYNVINCATFGGKNLYGWASWPLWLPASRFYSQRHAHRVLFDNKQGGFVEAADRIQIGNSGYTDTLPGLFEIRPVAGTIVSGDYCYVTITPYSNPRFWWQSGSSRIHADWEDDYATLMHPYLRPAADMVRVDLSVGNHNKNIIPGLDIQLNTPLEGDRSVISIGYEYSPLFSESGSIGSISGARECFRPMTARGIQPEEQSNTWNIYGTPHYLAKDGTQAVCPPRWHIYNVTGAEQTGCEFSIRPMVRLDQGNAIVPFDQWFMGYNVTTGLTPQSAARTISFTNYVAGSPATVDLLFSDGTISRLITEINSTTYVPTGVTHTDGVGLKCDGTTLYRWDAIGIYFVLSADLVVTQTAAVYCRKGHTIETAIDSLSTLSGFMTVTTPPFSKVIGAWNAFEDVVGGKFYPGSFAIPYAQRTGIIQTQGHDFEFFNSSVDAINSHWYNHQFCIATWMKLLESTEYDDMNEYAVMVTCDDPRYFQVIPHTWIKADSTAGRSWSIESTTPGSYKSLGSANVSVPDDEYSMLCSGSIHERKGGLVLRVNKLSSQLLDLMEDVGITIELTRR